MKHDRIFVEAKLEQKLQLSDTLQLDTRYNGAELIYQGVKPKAGSFMSPILFDVTDEEMTGQGVFARFSCYNLQYAVTGYYGDFYLGCGELYRERLDWIDTNTVGWWNLAVTRPMMSGKMKACWSFSNGDDAVRFKLTW